MIDGEQPTFRSDHHAAFDLNAAERHHRRVVVDVNIASKLYLTCAVDKERRREISSAALRILKQFRFQFAEAIPVSRICLPDQPAEMVAPVNFTMPESTRATPSAPAA